ncbi:fimbria/pilus outer membrane usher protein [Roseinatronobacter alkalisoli]|uniref:Fimbria/pilus outer membrane usher protein n=1 Tax=Roseinatronobacter alkalisoli TaxID=3028235 RepID=A0ABT5THC1_9RHOB|nr:fimbria/pilus outer membrane usher protein [Roseinatronobacter sp. HJB301]MDD7973577.1 fimbria/pilus outer membrane usher protein [Roseinatronobacter sp. HJB301]
MPQSHRDNRARQVLYFLGVSLFLQSAASGLNAEDMIVEEGRVLHLEVFVNGWSSDLITRFVDLDGGRLLADAEELERTGIKPIIAGRRVRGDIRVDLIENLSFELDEAAQILYFTAPMENYAPREINATASPTEPSPDEVDTGTGLVLNYSLNTELTRASAFSYSVAGEFDARLFTPFGTLNHSFTLAYRQGESRRYRRLTTYWRTPIPGRTTQVQLGDISTRGPAWARSVRMGGIILERNFELRPDLVTIALPSYEGSAEVPSTVDVYADSIRRFSTDVPFGPFLLADLPFSTGTTDAEIVVRDVTGRETRVNQPFFVSSELMRPGVFDYSLALGVPRLGIGTASDRYTGGVHGVGTLRFGLTPDITLMAHTEFGENLRMAGLGGTVRIGKIGTASASVAHSRSGFGTGMMGEFSTSLTLNSFRLSARAMRKWGEFSDIARNTSVESSQGFDPPAQITSLNQFSATMPVLSDRNDGGSIFYADTRRADGLQERSIGASYSTKVFDQGTLSLSAMASRGTTSNTVFGISMHVPLGSRRNAGTRVSSRDGRLRASSFISGTPKDRDRGWHWQAQAEQNTQPEIAASARRRSQYGGIEFATRHSTSRQAAGVRARGAVVFAGGGFFLSDRIEDAFVVVNAGAPGVEVQYENRSIGVTGPSGRMLVSGLRSYQRNALSIDPASLPLDADVPHTRQVVRPAQRSGVVLDFGINTNPATALVSLVTAEGEPIEVGLAAMHTESGESYIVGYDGQVYLRDLQKHNELIVHFPNMSTCRAEFDFTREPGTISQISGVVCQ